METVCPQCNNSLNSPTARLVQDSCGHKKCRLCLLQDESECKMCLQDKEANKTKVECVKYENNHTAVITCNKFNNVPEKSSKQAEKIKSKKSNIKDEPKSENEIDEATKKDEKESFGSATLPDFIEAVNENPVLYKCKICGKSFRTKSHIKYHSYCSGGQKPLRCDNCNKEFISKYHMEMHLLGHAGKKQYTCDICKKSFRQCGILNRHKLIHSAVKQFECQKCKKRFKSKDYLYRHSLIHNKEKLFSCKQCKARFNNRSNLNQHQATHTKEKIHMCDECGKRFKLKGALTVHRRSHSRLRPHECSTCSKTFINAKELHRHKLIHIDSKCFICNLCGLNFRRKDNLQRHIRNTHPGKGVTAPEQNEKNSDDTNMIEIKTDNNTPTENPNAIKVITASPINKKTAPTCNDEIGSNNNEAVSILSKPVPVINGPLKLAFKTTAFKSYYNIQRELPRFQPKSTYDFEESVNICKKILTPSNPAPPPQRTIIQTGKVSMKESKEICQKILQPDAPITNKAPNSNTNSSTVRCCKFEMPPSKYINLSKKNIFNDITDEGAINLCTYSDEKPPLPRPNSVIVKSNSANLAGQNELHWRRRALLKLEAEYKSLK